MCPDLKDENKPFKSQTIKSTYMTRFSVCLDFFPRVCRVLNFLFSEVLNVFDHLQSLGVGMWTKFLYPCLWYKTW